MGWPGRMGRWGILALGALALWLAAGRLVGPQGWLPVQARAVDRSVWLEAAWEDLARGQLGLAADKLRLAARSSPGDGEPVVLLAMVLAAQGEWAQALATSAQVAPDIPVSTRLVVEVLQGWAYQRLGQHAQAARAFGRALQAEPDATMAHLGLGLLAAEVGRQSGTAGQELERAWPGVDASQPVVWLAQAEAHLERAAELSPDRVETFIALGRLRLERQRWPQAISALKRASRLDHRRPEVHFLLGLAYLGMGQRREAEAAFREALELDPQHTEARLWLKKLLDDTAP